jgi:O-antigen ligase
MGLYMAHSVKEFFNGRHEYRMGIVRMIGVDDTFSNPNAFAASLLCALPLTFPFWPEATRLRERLALTAYTALTVFCILMTGSRASMVGLLALGFLRLITSKSRMKVLLILAVSMPAGWFLLPPKKQERFLTLIDPKYGPENAKESAEFRSHALVDGVRLWTESPVFGFGPGTFGRAAGHGWQAHNLYAQTIAEVGTLGALAMLGILAGFAVNACEMRAICLAEPALKNCFARQVSQSVSLIIVLLLILGCGGHNLYRYNWMWCGAFQAVALHCARERALSLENEHCSSQCE